MRVLTVVLVVCVAWVVMGCGPKKEELPQMDPADIQAPPPATPATPAVQIETPAQAVPAVPRGRERMAPDDSAGAAPQTYVVKKGEGLMAVARNVYGDSKLFKKIYEANKGKVGGPPNYVVKAGTVLTIPPK